MAVFLFEEKGIPTVHRDDGVKFRMRKVEKMYRK